MTGIPLNAKDAAGKEAKHDPCPYTGYFLVGQWDIVRDVVKSHSWKSFNFLFTTTFHQRHNLLKEIW